MLPTIQATDVAELRWHDALKRFGLTFSPNRPLYVRGLDFSPMVYYFTLRRDEGLAHVEATTVPLAIAEYHEHPGLLHRGEDTSHLVGVSGHRVGHVVVDDVGVVDDTRCPHGPTFKQTSRR